MRGEVRDLFLIRSKQFFCFYVNSTCRRLGKGQFGVEQLGTDVVTQSNGVELLSAYVGTQCNGVEQFDAQDMLARINFGLQIPVQQMEMNKSIGPSGKLLCLSHSTNVSQLIQLFVSFYL